MSTDAAIKEAVERIVQGLQRDPDSAQGTTHATARIDQGLTCIVTEGAWSLTSDVPPRWVVRPQDHHRESTGAPQWHLVLLLGSK